MARVKTPVPNVLSQSWLGFVMSFVPSSRSTFPSPSTSAAAATPTLALPETMACAPSAAKPRPAFTSLAPLYGSFEDVNSAPVPVQAASVVASCGLVHVPCARRASP